MSVNPSDSSEFLASVHENAPIQKNLEILFNGVTIGDSPFIELFMDCAERTKTPLYGWKVFRRVLRAFNLAQYFDYSLGLEGARAECGVFMGLTALMMAEINRLRDPGFQGGNFHLIDSFEGLSEPMPEDIPGGGALGGGSRFKKGHFAADIDQVRDRVSSFPDIELHKGWIPEVLGTLPEQEWAFVHIDVDLYEPTLGCLEYFVPRMVKGGCIINDDFSSPAFPGGFTGWCEYFERHGLNYVILDSGQSVFICE